MAALRFGAMPGATASTGSTPVSDESAIGQILIVAGKYGVGCGGLYRRGPLP